MISKTLEQWRLEAEKYASICYEKYVASINDKSCNDTVRHHYSDVAKNNWDLKELLAHIQKYDSAIAIKKCPLCQTNASDHNGRLWRTYSKYQRWVDSATKNTAMATSIKSHQKLIATTDIDWIGPIAGVERQFDIINQRWVVRSQLVKGQQL